MQESHAFGLDLFQRPNIPFSSLPFLLPSADTVWCDPMMWLVQTFVTMNIPKGHPIGALSVGLYSIAIMMSYPLQLFPAVKCLEG